MVDFRSSGVVKGCIVVTISKLRYVIFLHLIHSFFFMRKKRKNKGKKAKKTKMRKEF